MNFLQHLFGKRRNLPRISSGTSRTSGPPVTGSAATINALARRRERLFLAGRDTSTSRNAWSNFYTAPHYDRGPRNGVHGG